MPQLWTKVDTNQHGLTEPIWRVPRKHHKNEHLSNFLEICNTVKYNGVDQWVILGSSFSLSHWGKELEHGFNLCHYEAWLLWEDIAQKFLIKFFPPSKTLQVRVEITQFRQHEFEQIYEAWERFKEMLRKCPQHGIEDWLLVQLFYNDLNGQTKSHIDALSWRTTSLMAQMFPIANDQLQGLTSCNSIGNQEAIMMTQAMNPSEVIEESNWSRSWSRFNTREIHLSSQIFLLVFF